MKAKLLKARGQKYISKVYTFDKTPCMKILSLKLDDKTFEEAESITASLKLPRNRYINEAVHLYNQYNRRKLLKKQLMAESRLTAKDSLEVLSEFEKMIDED